MIVVTLSPNQQTSREIEPSHPWLSLKTKEREDLRSQKDGQLEAGAHADPRGSSRLAVPPMWEDPSDLQTSQTHLDP